MKTYDTGAGLAQHQPAAVPSTREAIRSTHGATATQRGLQADINQSPRMLAQRRALQAAFGSAHQRPAGDLQNDAPMQARAAPVTGRAQEDRGVTANQTGMPNQLKAGIEALSGMDMSDVRVHRNSGKPAQLSALAYAQGNQIHLGPGQERHLPHEAWHVVQQRQGRVQPTMQMAGVGVNDDVRLEREADSMGAKALQRVVETQSPAVPASNSSLPSQLTVQKVDVGYAPANPAMFRTTTTIAGLGGTPASDKPFHNGQRAQIYADNVAHGGGAAPVVPAGNNPRDDFSNGALLDRQVGTNLEPEVDHIVPRAQGGANDYSNARVLSKNNNLNGAPPRPNNAQKVFRLYEPITLSANIPQFGQPNYVLHPTPIAAGANLSLTAAQLLAIHANVAVPAQLTDLGQAGANAITNAGRNTQNGVTVA
jgi:hypothetical protein